MSEKNDEKGFNDTKLQDIMDEIESLEQEFVEDDGASETVEAKTEESTPEPEPEPATPTPEPKAKTTKKVVETKAETTEETSKDVDDVLGQIENEIENEITDNVVEMKQPEPAPKPATPIAETTTPTPITTPVATPEPAASGSAVSFTGNGQLDFQMSVNLGGKTATLKVDPGKGLVVNLEDVDLQITKDGYNVEIDRRVKFSVPFGNTDVAKKAA